VQCYSSYQTVELFVNGKSFEKHSKNPKKLLGTYRHIWSQVPYEPGELRVKAYDNNGNIMDETCIRTAGAPAKLEIEYERHGKMVFAFVSITDSDGNLCPEASSRVDFASDGRIIAADAGDATSLKPFHLPYANAFHGKCAVWIKSEKNISLTVSSVLNGKTITKTLHEK
jgi:beta-galactosidase